MNLFFDFDGTIIDSRLRLYSLFQHLVINSELTFEEYWSRKMSGISHRKILSREFRFSEIEIELFLKRWLNLIETDVYLKLDKPIEGAYSFLTRMKLEGNHVYIVTARQKKQKVLSQVINFGWDLKLFDEVLVTEHKVKKSELIKPYIESDIPNWVIGDTGLDILTGRELNMKTVAVLSGFLNKEVLMTYSPDIIVQDLTRIVLK